MGRIVHFENYRCTYVLSRRRPLYSLSLAVCKSSRGIIVSVNTTPLAE